jgi:magnesium transporter
MKVNCYLISEEAQLLPLEYNAAIESIRKKDARIWIDIQDAETAELEEKLDDINIHGLIRSFCLESRDHPGFYPLKPVALMVIPVQMEKQESNVMEYLAILFSEDFFISIRKSKIARFRKSITSEDTIDLLPDNSVAGVISTLMMGLSLDCLRKVARLSDTILALEEKMERDPGSVKIEEISNKRSELLTLESIVQGQSPIIETIISSDKPAKNAESTLEYLRWTATNLKSADKKLDWLEHRIEVMRSLIDMHAQDRTNRRLGRLTVLSMIFMPVTFLAGIWGMNFKSMPLLSMKYGYVPALGIMFLISWGMYLYFHRKGWFD